jgi:hypothetical protein
VTKAIPSLADMDGEITALRKLARRYAEITQRRQSMPPPGAVIFATPFDPACVEAMPTRQQVFHDIAAADPEEASLYFAIREIGWKFFATGGLDLMRDALDAADDGCCIATIDAIWCAIGSKAAGHWWS